MRSKENHRVCLYLCATIDAGYFQMLGIMDPVEQDECALALCKSFGTATSKTSYSENGDTRNSSRMDRNCYFLPQSRMKDVIQAIGFQGTDEEFQALVGWLASKSSLIKQNFEAKRELLDELTAPNPFEYSECTTNYSRMRKSNNAELAKLDNRNRTELIFIDSL